MLCRVSTLAEQITTQKTWGWCSVKQHQDLTSSRDELKNKISVWAQAWLLAGDFGQFKKTHSNADHKVEIQSFLLLDGDLSALENMVFSLCSVHNAIHGFQTPEKKKGNK